jgi:hypothetical protein
MARRNTSKDELFAIGCAKGMTQLEAYETAGFEPNRSAAHRKYWEMKDRIDEIQSQMLSQLIVDKNYVMAELLSTYVYAKTVHDITNRRLCLNLIGLEFGMFTERKDVNISGKYEGWDRPKIIEHLQHVAEQLAIEDRSEKEDGEAVGASQ